MCVCVCVCVCVPVSAAGVSLWWTAGCPTSRRAALGRTSWWVVWSTAQSHRTPPHSRSSWPGHRGQTLVGYIIFIHKTTNWWQICTHLVEGRQDQSGRVFEGRKSVSSPQCHTNKKHSTPEKSGVLTVHPTPHTHTHTTENTRSVNITTIQQFIPTPMTLNPNFNT